MADRPSWQGFLKLSLVSCEVELYSAVTREHTISFHLINPETNNRIQMKPYDPDTGLLERKDLVRGYEIEDGRYAIVEDADLEKIRLKSTRTIEVGSFVDEDDIDPVYRGTPYFVVPHGAPAVEAYAVIREAMRKERKVALGRLVLSFREHLVAILPRGKGMFLYILRTAREVRDDAKLFKGIGSGKVDPRMVDIATEIIEQKSGKFDPGEFEDHYESALRALLKARSRGKKLVAVEEPEEDSNVVDLMAALKASIGRRGKDGKKGTGEVVPLRRAPRRPASQKRKPRRKGAA